MAGELQYHGAPGQTLDCVLLTVDHAQAWTTDGDELVAYDNSDLDEYKLAVSDDTGLGLYLANAPDDLPAGSYVFVFMDAGEEVISSGVLVWNGEREVTPLAPIYHADIQYTRDGSNRDEYTVTWFKDGIPQTSGITSPTIQVVKRADGTDLVASTAMTQIGSTGTYKYTEATNKQTRGEAVLVIVGATIDASGRTWRKPLGRDA